MRPTATKKWAIDPFTSCEIIYFYNPRIKQFVVMMRDIATKRFIRRLRELYVCSVKSFDTRTPEEEWAYPRKKKQKDRSKNIWIECAQTGRITEDKWIKLTSKEDFENIIREVAKYLLSRCQTCWDLFEKATAIPIHLPRVEAYLLTVEPCDIYCCYARPRHEYAISLEEMQVRCFDKDRCEVDELGRLYCPEMYETLPYEIKEEVWKRIFARALGTHTLRTVAMEVLYDDAPTYTD